MSITGLVLSDTVSILQQLGINRNRTTVYRWVQKADLSPTDGTDQNHVVVDETVIQLNAEKYWLYAAVDPDTNCLLHVRLYPTGPQALTETFLGELHEKYQFDNRIHLVDDTPCLQVACHRQGLRFQHGTQRSRNTVERVFRELKRRTNQFSNTFSLVEPGTAKNWVQASIFAWNQPI